MPTLPSICSNDFAAAHLLMGNVRWGMYYNKVHIGHTIAGNNLLLLCLGHMTCSL